jgi:peptidoglycan hydrolase-like protein with peptidoglycan-binding domain
MKKRVWLALLSAVLLAIAIPVVHGGVRASAAQSTKKKKSTSSKSKTTKKAKATRTIKKTKVTKTTRTRRRRRVAKPKGQMAPTTDRIKEIQTALQHEGTYQGEPNGKWDNATMDAMKQYQDKNGLTATGKIDALTLEKLGLGADTAGKGAPLPIESSSPNPAPNSAQ